MEELVIKKLSGEEDFRIRTSVKNQTISAPLQLVTQDEAIILQNLGTKYQVSLYFAINAQLAHLGLKLETLAKKVFTQKPSYNSYSGNSSQKTTFVMFSGDYLSPAVIWQKYEGGTGGSGGNFIFYKGVKYNTTSFIILNKNQLLEL